MLHRIDQLLALMSVAGAALLIALLAGGPGIIGAKRTEAKISTPSGAVSGSELFTRSGCNGCHTLYAAGASGTTGPNLDSLRPTAAQVATVVASGRGIMPSFKDRLSASEIEALSAYVQDNAGR